MKLVKLERKYYLDESGKKVPKGTEGAIEKPWVSPKWYIRYKQDGKLKQVPAYKDKRASEKKMAELQTSLERGEVGLIDPYKEHRNRKAEEHLSEYIPHLNKRASNPKYLHETKRLLERTLKLCGIATLGDLTSERFEDFLTGLDKAPNTRKKYYAAMSGFAEWLFKRRRTPENIMWRVDVPKGKVKNDIRSLSIEEIKQVLATAEQRPLREALLVRRGPDKGKLVANVREKVETRLKLLGRERVLLYKMSLFTGLRKEELARVRVSDIDFAHLPHPVLVLQVDMTKGKKAASLWLIPEYADELKSWIRDTNRKPGDKLFYVPKELNRIFTRDLKSAGVAVETVKGTAKFRSLRKSANVVLREADVPSHTRMLFMRHSDIRLTTDTYDDGRLMDMSEVVQTLEGIWKKMGQQKSASVDLLKSNG